MARQTVVVALGISADGTRHPLGLWQGSTENAAICTSLLQDLIGRVLKLDGRIPLCSPRPVRSHDANDYRRRLAILS